MGCNCKEVKEKIKLGYETKTTLGRIIQPFRYVSSLIQEGVFLDLGSGEGNILDIAKYYFPRMELWGIEINPDLVKNHKNVWVGNMFNYKHKIGQATVIYIYEPFRIKYVKTMLEVIIPESKVIKYVILNSVSYVYGGGFKILRSYFDNRDVRCREHITILAR